MPSVSGFQLEANGASPRLASNVFILNARAFTVEPGRKRVPRSRTD